MAPDAVIRGRAVLTRGKGEFAALLGMAGLASCVEVRRRLFPRGLHMRVVARNASHAAGAGPITLAQSHRVEVLKMIGLRGGLSGWRNHQNRENIVQWRSRPEVLIRLALFEDAHVAGLMAGHTDVVRQIHAEAGGIYDGLALPGRVSRIHGANVCRA